MPSLDFASFFALFALSSFAGWCTGRIASRASRLPGWTDS